MNEFIIGDYQIESYEAIYPTTVIWFPGFISCEKQIMLKKRREKKYLDQTQEKQAFSSNFDSFVVFGFS